MFQGRKPHTLEEFQAYIAEMAEAANRASSIRKPPPTLAVAGAASADSRPMLDTKEVLGLTTSPERAGKVGFDRDTLGCAFADFQAYVDRHGDPATWKLFGRYLRDLGRQTEEGIGWIIEGTVGTGKTCALALLAEAEILRTGGIFEPPTEAECRGERKPRLHLLLVSMVELADFLMRRQRDEAWTQHFNQLKRVQHLMIDDLGSEYLEPFGGNLFYELINERCAARRCTHFTLNGTVDELGEAGRYGVNAKRIKSRLRRRNHVMTLAGPDRRELLDARSLLQEVSFV